MVKHLKKYNLDELAEKKYNHLLVGMIVLFLVGPLYMKTGLKFPLIAFIFFGIIQLALKATIDNRRRLLPYGLLVLMAFVCILLSRLQALNPEIGDLFYVVGRSIYIIFLALTIRIFMRRIIAAQRVTADKIKGGICLYLLAGVVWAFLYEVIYRFDSAAFQIENTNPLSFIYYSYSTLTTLGIGDITPTNDFAISLTSLEAIAGQMFLAVFIAWLIGLHIMQKYKRVEK